MPANISSRKGEKRNADSISEKLSAVFGWVFSALYRPTIRLWVPTADTRTAKAMMQAPMIAKVE